MYRILFLCLAAGLIGGCAGLLKYSPPTVLSGNNHEVKVRVGISAGHPGGTATEHCRHYGKSAVMSDDPPEQGYWPNTKVYYFECQ